jgi:hypothetical protein
MKMIFFILKFLVFVALIFGVGRIISHLFKLDNYSDKMQDDRSELSEDNNR